MDAAEKLFRKHTMFKTKITCLLTLLLLTRSAARAQELPDSLRAQVEIKVYGDAMLKGPTQQLFQLHLISAGVRIEQETPGWFLEVQVIEAESAWVALSMVVSQPINKIEKPKGRMSTSELESGDWVRDYVSRERLDYRWMRQHEVVLVARDELEAGVSELVRRFSTKSIVPMRKFWLERLNRK